MFNENNTQFLLDMCIEALYVSSIPLSYPVIGNIPKMILSNEIYMRKT